MFANDTGSRGASAHVMNNNGSGKNQRNNEESGSQLYKVKIYRNNQHNNTHTSIITERDHKYRTNSKDISKGEYSNYNTASLQSRRELEEILDSSNDESHQGYVALNEAYDFGNATSPQGYIALNETYDFGSDDDAVEDQNAEESEETLSNEEEENIEKGIWYEDHYKEGNETSSGHTTTTTTTTTSNLSNNLKGSKKPDSTQQQQQQKNSLASSPDTEVCSSAFCNMKDDPFIVLFFIVVVIGLVYFVLRIRHRWARQRDHRGEYRAIQGMLNINDGTFDDDISVDAYGDASDDDDEDDDEIWNFGGKQVVEMSKLDEEANGGLTLEEMNG